MANIAVSSMTLEVKGQNGGTIVSVPVVTTLPSTEVFINDSPCYFGDISVTIPSGATSSLGTLTAPVTVTVTASGSNAYTSDGNALLEGDASDGTASGDFYNGETTTTDFITVTVKSAGQTDVDLT